MLGSAMLFLNWRFVCTDTSDKNTAIADDGVEISPSQDTLARHLTNPLFVVVTLFLSCFLLTVAFLPVVWFPWIMHLTNNNLKLGLKLTFISKFLVYLF